MCYQSKLVPPHHPAVSVRATEVMEDETPSPLLGDMLMEVMLWDALGVAAPQIGVSKRACIVKGAGAPAVMYNPVILQAKGENIQAEGCLTLRGQAYNVKRATHITVSYRDQNWSPQIEECNGLRARIIQHEIDHLDGILISDRAI